MQRWIAVGVLVTMLVLGGVGIAYWYQKQNAPAPMWVPLPMNAEIGEKERAESIRDLREKLLTGKVLMQVSKDLDLAGKWNLASAAEAEHELAKRAFVRSGDMDSPMGKVPAVHIGIMGPSKESKLSGQIAVRLMDDVWGILGIKPPPKR